MVPLQRPDEIHIPSPSWMQTNSGFEDMSCEQAIPTMITWTYGGKEVAVEGSWDNWKIRFVENFLFPIKFELYDQCIVFPNKFSWSECPYRDLGKTSPL